MCRRSPLGLRQGRSQSQLGSFATRQEAFYLNQDGGQLGRIRIGHRQDRRHRTQLMPSLFEQRTGNLVE